MNKLIGSWIFIFFYFCMLELFWNVMKAFYKVLGFVDIVFYGDKIWFKKIVLECVGGNSRNVL